MEFKNDLLSSVPFYERRTCQMMHTAPAVCAHSGSLRNYFGDGSDGAVTISTNINWETSTGEHDTGVVIKNFTSLTIDAGTVVTAAHRAKAMLVYVTGDCTINGELSMSKRGAIGSAPNLLAYSEDLSADVWQNLLSGGTTLTVNAGLAPNGETSADLVKQIDGTSDGLYQVLELPRATQFCYSAYIKNDGAGRTRMAVLNSTWASFAEITFTWSGGVPTTHSSIAANDITLTAAANGFYRI
jgi:hypothetical protein